MNHFVNLDGLSNYKCSNCGGNHESSSFCTGTSVDGAACHNYASDIYGKQNNKWILSNSQTGEEILNVKSTPYFIFTFSETGNYTIYNQVEDSFGNVYAVTKPGFIEVVNHKVKKPEDTNPNYVDSFDYGYPEPFTGRDSQAMKLSKDLAESQIKIMEGNNPPIGTGLVIPNNPDSTFRED